MSTLTGPGDQFTKLADLEEHPEAGLVPDVSEEEDVALLADVKENGVHIPIIHHEGRILDGHRRFRAAKNAGLSEVPAIRKHGLTEDEEVELLVRLNGNRRQWSREQKRDAAGSLREKGWSYRRIAGVLGVHHTTVNRWVDQLVQMRQLSAPEEVTGRDGRVRPATKPGHRGGVMAGKKGRAEARTRPERGSPEPRDEPTEDENGPRPKDVECPVCGEDPGFACRTKDGVLLSEAVGGSIYHPSRMRSWKKADGIPESPEAPDDSGQPTPPDEGVEGDSRSERRPVADDEDAEAAGDDDPIGVLPSMEEEDGRRYEEKRAAGAVPAEAEATGPDDVEIGRGTLQRWVEAVPSAPDTPTRETTTMLASEPLSEEECARLMAVSRYIQKLVATSRRIRETAPTP